MATFDFIHTVRYKYREAGGVYPMGKGWEFRVAPSVPTTRIFTLTMTGMQWFTDTNGVVINTTSPDRNLLRLDQFYQTHQLHMTFTYPHPVFGNLTVRFDKPLEIPDAMKGGSGVVETFDIVLGEVKT